MNRVSHIGASGSWRQALGCGERNRDSDVLPLLAAASRVLDDVRAMEELDLLMGGPACWPVEAVIGDGIFRL